MEEFFENELAKKFEEMVENNEEYYFDTDQLEEIIIYYLELGDISFAEKAVQYALQLHPNSQEIKTKKLEVLLELEQYVEAREIINELQEACMEDTDFLVCCAKYYSNLGNTKKAIEYCQKALLLGEEENFLHNFIADEFLNLEDPFSALQHYQQALIHDPQDEYSLENIVFCFQQLKKFQDAVDFLNTYLDRFPFSETAWFEYGQLFFGRKNYREAIKAFDYLLAINPNAVSVYANKAACFERLKNWSKAIEIYKEMLDLEYTKAFTFYKIGLCYKALQQPINAMSAFQQSLREDPQYYLSMMEQSFLYEEMGSKKEALHFAKEATALNESNLDYQKRLAFLYIDSGNIEESLQCLKKLVQVEPGRFYNWYAYAEVLMLLGEYQEAEEILQQALRKHKRAELYYQLSNCYYNLKDQHNATIALQKAVDKDASLRKDMELKYPFLKGTDKSSSKN